MIIKTGGSSVTINGQTLTGRCISKVGSLIRSIPVQAE